MQRGTIIKQNNRWCLRYYENVLRGSDVVRKKSFKVLAPIGKDYPTKTSVLPLADKHLSPINLRSTTPEASLPMTIFIKDYYFPWAAKNLRHSTVNGYKDIFQNHVKKRLEDIRLRDFKTVHGQRLVAQIPDIGHKSLQRVKSFLSGVITYALREGILEGHNPMHPVKVPGRPKKFKAPYYDLNEVFDIGQAVSEYDGKHTQKKFSYAEVPKGAAFAVVCTAAFAGLRLSEVRGLRWQDYDGAKLDISRTVWGTHVGPTKTEDAEASVPVLPVLRGILDAYKKTVPNQPDDYIFAGPRRKAPLNLHNLSARIIKPALKEKNIEWKGWQAFRRGLASTLYELGVAPKIIQAILRHSDIGTTLQYYTQVPDAATREALKKIDDWITRVDEDGRDIMTSDPDYDYTVP